ncbi:unnamed protein product [Staurois parvus]|uniref:ATP synthase F0 subunit 8 n=1 Tax=Staurois parvus TaxID=386267 RepID=A0ABN9GUF5_9NEOB|nr:unnamed protein product [Staurois parvus]
MALHRRAIQSSVLTVKTHTQPTVNPLIAPHVNPFHPSAISTVSVLFVALITVLVSLWMSVTPSQFPPVSECLPQSRYKSLIAPITSKENSKKLIPAYIPPFVNAITFT